MIEGPLESSDNPSGDSATEKTSSEDYVKDSSPPDSLRGIANTTGSSNQIKNTQKVDVPNPNPDQVEETARRNNGNGEHRETASSEPASKRADEYAKRSNRDGEHRETASSESVSKGTDESAKRSNGNGEHRETASSEPASKRADEYAKRSNRDSGQHETPPSEPAAERADPTRQNNKDSQTTGDLFRYSLNCHVTTILT